MSQPSQWSSTIPWPWVVILVALAVVVVFAIRALVPGAAQAVAGQVPDSLVQAIGAQTLLALDTQMTQPSALAEERQQAIREQFARLRLPGSPAARYDIVFRKSEALGANALALPSGTVVVTDGLVQLAKDDRELLGVLAHEAGHVEQRHGVRLIVQSSLMGMVIAWALGDISTVAAGAPAALLEAKYSRDLEREADAFAVEAMRANGIDTTHLAAILRRMEEQAGGSGPGYLSTHPATDERLEALTRGRPQ